MKFQITSLEEWNVVIKPILPKLIHPILLLKGNLGAGKTTFSQFLLKELGSQDEISSPTYSIVNEYNTPKGKVFHFDLYRLRSVEEAYDFGIEEYLENCFRFLFVQTIFVPFLFFYKNILLFTCLCCFLQLY